MGKPPKTGIESAVREEVGWVFRDRHPFWAGCEERPEEFPECREGSGEQDLIALGESMRDLLDEMASTCKRHPEILEELEAAAARFRAATTHEERLAIFDEASELHDKAMESDVDTMMGDLAQMFGLPLDEEDDEEDEQDDEEGSDDAGGEDEEESAQGWGEVILECEDDEEYMPEQRAAYEEYVRNEAEIGPRVLDALYRYYNKLRSRGHDMGPRYVPAVRSPSELRKLISYAGLSIGRPDERDICSITFEFGCWWDQEHGAGVRIRAGNVVKVASLADFADEDTR